MRAFAEFVMRGRAQAWGVGIGCAILPFFHWIGTAVVGLVLLRRGPVEGALLMLWASLPLVAWYMVNQDASPLLVLIGTFGLAYILRSTASWELTLCAAVVVAGVSGLVFSVLSADLLVVLGEWYLEVVAQVQQGEGPEMLPEDARQVLVGLFAMGQAVAMIGALLLSRWWQSVLYNPGGFQQEIHSLRLSPVMSSVIVGAMVLVLLIGDPAWTRWIPLLTVPLILSAVGFIHWLIKAKGLPMTWLVVFYVSFLLLIQLLYPLLTSVALLDSWMDLRKRFGSEKPDNEV